MSEPLPRLPLEPLLAAARAAGGRFVVTLGTPSSRDDAFSLSWFARCIGVQPRQVYRWRTEGGVPIYNADKAACRLGLHPALVWPEWFALVAA